VLDDKNVRRRFRASNYQSTTRVKPFICTMPMRLDEGWNQIQFNLSDFTRRAYGTNYIETLRVQIHANCRIRRCLPACAFLPAAPLRTTCAINAYVALRGTGAQARGLRQDHPCILRRRGSICLPLDPSCSHFSPGSTFRTACTQKTSCRLSSNSSFLCRISS